MTTNIRLFTIVYEYNGGTYIRQIRARDPVNCLKGSMPTLLPLLPVTQAALEEGLAGHNIVLVNECLNVWSATGLVNDQLLLIHIVDAAEDSPISSHGYSFDELEQ